MEKSLLGGREEENEKEKNGAEPRKGRVFEMKN